MVAQSTPVFATTLARVTAARTPADVLLAAGGGRPGTGYVGAAIEARFPSSDEVGNAVGIEVNYALNLAERFSLELSLGRIGQDVDRGGPVGELKTTALGAVAQFGRPSGSARWYAGGGLGVWLNDLSGLGADAADSVALILAGGADFPLSSHGNLCLEFRYMLASAEVSTGGEIDLDAFAARVNYVFRY